MSVKSHSMQKYVRQWDRLNEYFNGISQLNFFSAHFLHENRTVFILEKSFHFIFTLFDMCNVFQFAQLLSPAFIRKKMSARI